jgi:ribosomal protein S16
LATSNNAKGNLSDVERRLTDFTDFKLEEIQVGIGKLEKMPTENLKSEAAKTLHKSCCNALKDEQIDKLVVATLGTAKPADTPAPLETPMVESENLHSFHKLGQTASESNPAMTTKGIDALAATLPKQKSEPPGPAPSSPSLTVDQSPQKLSPEQGCAQAVKDWLDALDTAVPICVGRSSRRSLHFGRAAVPNGTRAGGRWCYSRDISKFNRGRMMDGIGKYTPKPNVPQKIDRETKRDNVAKVTRTHAQHTRTASQSVNLATATVDEKAKKAEKTEEVRTGTWTMEAMDKAVQLRALLARPNAQPEKIVKAALELYKAAKGLDRPPEDLMAQKVRELPEEVRRNIATNADWILNNPDKIHAKGSAVIDLLQAVSNAARI